MAVFIFKRLVFTASLLFIATLFLFYGAYINSNSDWRCYAKRSDYPTKYVYSLSSQNLPIHPGDVYSADYGCKQYSAPMHLVAGYGFWLYDRAFRLDFGESLGRVSGEEHEGDSVQKYAPASLKLWISSIVFAVLIGFPLGILSAIRHRTIWDGIVKTFSALGRALPLFWLAPLLIPLFSLDMGDVDDPNSPIYSKPGFYKTDYITT